MAPELRVGLIGAGGRGRYIAPLIRDAGDVRLVAAADVSEESRRRALEACGFERAHESYEEMLAREELDAVLVATSHDRLADACLAAIGAGKHVFVEKPMAADARQGAAVVRAARAAGLRLMIGYCMRYTPSRTLMKDLLDQGAVGEVVAVHGAKGSEPLSGWLADPARGGGQMLFLGSHLIDQVLWLTGQRPERVYAEVRRRQDTGSDDTTAFSLCFAGGATAQLLLTQRAGVNTDFVEVFGTRGRVRSEWHSMAVYVHSQVLSAYSHPTTIAVQADFRRPMYAAELVEFVRAIREGRDPAIAGEQGLVALEVIDAVFESERTGQPTRVGVAAAV